MTKVLTFIVAWACMIAALVFWVRHEDPTFHIGLAMFNAIWFFGEQIIDRLDRMGK